MEGKYFASSNSYKGFYSLFDRIFDSKNFDDVMVLKGGPGTGKSTIMKRFSQFIEQCEGRVRHYHCSSDTSSLDGVTADLNDKKIAMIDGTAPHQRDAIYVGAVDEIINLGESVNREWISKHREAVISLSQQKTEAYKAAYSYLRVAGKCYEEIYSKRASALRKESALQYIKHFDFQTFQEGTRHQKTFISSFSKDGYKSFDIPSTLYKDTTKIGGDSQNIDILLRLVQENTDLEFSHIFPSPLTPHIPEALITSDRLIIKTDGDQYDISADEFFNNSKVDSEEIRFMEKTRGELVCEATRWLKIASDIHFRLEEIYSECMNFENNDMIFDKICKNVLKVCDCKP